MGQLEDMTVFIRIVEAGGIGKAAEQLNLVKSAVSRRLAELEKRLGTRLIIRTTRKSSLTDAGQRYYHSAIKIIDEVAELNTQTGSIDADLDGTLRLALPLSFGIMHLTPVIDLFTKQHPKLTIQTDFSDRHIDLVEEGFDLAIRIGDLKDSSLQAKRITKINHALCASPAYIKENGQPKLLSDLQQHQFLQYGMTSLMTCTAVDPQGINQSVQLSSQVKSNNGDFLRDMAITGHGITLLPTFITWQALARGDLMPLLMDHQLLQTNAYAVYPQNRFLSQRARLFIDFVTERFGDNPYWDQL